MPLNNPKSGYNLVGEFQISAAPWVTSSTITGVKVYTFDRVTSWILVKNTGGTTMHVGFTSSGTIGSNYFSLGTNDSFTGDLRLTEVWLSGSAANTFTLMAGLTNISSIGIPTITGSNGFDGVG